METIRMIDIISLIGLPPPINGRSSYYVQCPCCDSGKHKHLNINLKKEVFRCPKCGVNGGMFDLYSLYTGVPRDKVWRALSEKLKPQGNVNIPKRAVYTPPEDVETTIADIEIRNAVYNALLQKLSLAKDHRENLLSRGLSSTDIDRLGYKTTAAVGFKSIAKQLENDGYQLSGVPGFYRLEDGSWTFIAEQRGTLIPVRDVEHRIQGLQIRRDNATKRKFRWVSSTERTDGCRAESWTHIAGDIKPIMLITEGPMKADIIHALTGLSVIAVPGVNALAKLKLALEYMRKNGLTEIKTAFDMDFIINWNVQEGYVNLLRLLNEMGFKFGTYLWNPYYKGLDDYIWEYMLEKNRNNIE